MKIKFLQAILITIIAANSSAFAMPENANLTFVKLEKNSAQISNNLNENVEDMKLQMLSAQNEVEKLQESNYILKKSIIEEKNKIDLLEKQKAFLEQILSAKEKQINELSKVSNADTNSEIDEFKNLIANYKQKIEDLSLKLTSADNEQKVYLKAVEYLKKDNSNSAKIYYNLAKAYYDEKNYSAAMQNYNLALSMNPELTGIYRDLGIIYAETGKYQDSINNFNKYLKYLNNPQEEIVIRRFISKLTSDIN